MQLKEIEKSLPNGFHDALLSSIEIDYASRKIIIKLQILVGNPDGEDYVKRNEYRSAILTVSDFLYIAMEPPNVSQAFREPKELLIDGGEPEAGKAPLSLIALDQLPAGAFAYWFYSSRTNSFIHIAAQNASLDWRSTKKE